VATAGALHYPEPATLAHISSQSTIDQALAELYANKDAWTHMAMAGKAAILSALQGDLQRQGPAWVTATLAAKGVGPGGFAEGEEWSLFGGLLRLLRLLRQSLLAIDRYGHPLLPGKPARCANGQMAVPMFPTSRLERVLLMHTQAVTWLEPGVDKDNLFLLPPSRRQGEQAAGSVALVLGAGNAGVLPCADLLHKLFVEEQVVALKLSPVNSYLGPILEQGFKQLIERGFLRILYGGAAAGAYLCEHPLVATIHLTGSDKTYENIVFGAGEEGSRRKAARTPRLAKPVTAELGCVNPAIIVPGNWSAQDIRRAAELLATWLYSNAGCSCLTPRLLIQHRQWPQRQALLAALGEALAAAPLRAAYYPGSAARHAEFVAAHLEARIYGAQDADGAAPSGHGANGSMTPAALPWTLIADVDARNLHDICLRTEPFCGVLSETALDASTPADFLAQATAFANDAVWGTLSAVLLVPDGVAANQQLRAALDRALADLRYGTVAVNLFTGLAYALMNTPWGSYPGQDPADIQSGSGFVNNPYMLRQPQKTIFRAPFQRVDPVMLHHPAAGAFGREYAGFQAQPSLGRLLRVMRVAVSRG